MGNKKKISSMIMSEIIIELKLRILHYFSKHPLYIETWPHLFFITTKLYKEIIDAKASIDIKNMYNERKVVSTLVKVLEDLIIPSASTSTITNFMSDETRILVDDILKRSGIATFQVFYHIVFIASNGEKKGESLFCESILATASFTESEEKFSDELSTPLFFFLRQKFNLLIIDEYDWPILVSYSIRFFTEMFATVPVERQKKILREVLLSIYNQSTAATSNSTTNTTTTSISSIEVKIESSSTTSISALGAKKIIPLIDFIYNGLHPVGMVDDDKNNTGENKTFGENPTGCAKCCIIL